MMKFIEITVHTNSFLKKIIHEKIPPKAINTARNFYPPVFVWNFDYKKEKNHTT